jgi:hypothetical protein
MKAFITSVGERTTDICIERLNYFGFETVVFRKQETWWDKYKHFISQASEPCIRVDADTIINANIIPALLDIDPEKYMVQFHYYCLYSNSVRIGCPVYYNEKALEIIKRNLGTLNHERPETFAWRLPEINNGHNFTDPSIVGIHGFYQDVETIIRAKNNKLIRKQDGFDFELALNLANL